MKNPVRMAFQTGQAELVVASYDAQEASSGTVPPAPPDDSSVPDIGDTFRLITHLRTLCTQAGNLAGRIVLTQN
jgi:hypothetical protein